MNARDLHYLIMKIHFDVCQLDQLIYNIVINLFTYTRIIWIKASVTYTLQFIICVTETSIRGIFVYLYYATGIFHFSIKYFYTLNKIIKK